MLIYEELFDLIWLDVLLMLCGWLWVSYNKHAGLVDAIWAFGIALNVILASIMWDVAPVWIRVFLGGASGIWFLRLTWHLLRRYFSETEEDTRYANMRLAMGKYQHLGFLAFFIFQAGLIVLFSYPMLALLSVPINQWGPSTAMYLILAAVIMLVAFFGESLADEQLYRFKQDPENKGKTMDQGLWRYSRHPNYFFEWLHWFAYPIIGLTAGVYALWFYPILMWLFLYYVTGIPFSEQQALAHRGDNYKDYQRRTSMFIPWQPKE